MKKIFSGIVFASLLFAMIGLAHAGSYELDVENALKGTWEGTLSSPTCSDLKVTLKIDQAPMHQERNRNALFSRSPLGEVNLACGERIQKYPLRNITVFDAYLYNSGEGREMVPTPTRAYSDVDFGTKQIHDQHHIIFPAGIPVRGTDFKLVLVMPSPLVRRR